MPTVPISVRLDPDVRAALERDAKDHRVGLATYLRQLAAARARVLRKQEIREESRRAAQALHAEPENLDSLEAWSMPTAWKGLE